VPQTAAQLHAQAAALPPLPHAPQVRHSLCVCRT
jgi:hypothetical protein